MLPSPNDLILVVLLNNLRDFEIARILGWYRIPLRSAPKVIAVDYLAFYQTAVFKDAKWCIQWIAPVLGHELTTRQELIRDEIDHPRAHHEYYKIQLGSLELLPKTIPAQKWKRLTFLYTTGEYLQKANSLKELVVKSEERSLLWQALRDRANQSQQYGFHNEALSELNVDPKLLAVLLGIQNFPEEPG
jgi:hypothetical protein